MNAPARQRKPSPAGRIAMMLAVPVVAGVLVLASLWLSGAVFLALGKADPTQARPLSILQYWGWYRGTELDRKLKGAIGLSFLSLCVLGPLGVYSASRPRRSVHGDARFAKLEEVQAGGLLVKDAATPTILLGKFKGRFLGVGGPGFVMLSAPTRSGKGIGVVIPNLLSWPHSAVVNDIKGELWTLTAGYRQSLGQRVYRWAPFDPSGRSCQYNPLGYLDPASNRIVSDILAIGQLFYPHNPKGSDSDKFFADNARNMFMGLVLYLLDTPERPRTIGELLRVASGDGRSLKDYLTQLIAQRQTGPRPLRDECVHAFSRLLATPDNTMGAIVSTFNSPLTIFADHIVDTVTSANSFDIRDLRKTPTTVYLEVPPDKLGSAYLLINLFFSQVCDLSAQTLPQFDASLKYQVLLVLDEFPSLGRVNAISQSIAYLAGYGLRLLTITQSKAQLTDIYGREQAENFVANHSAKIMYTPATQEDAEEYSKRIGYYGEQARSRGRSHSHGQRSSSSTSTNLSEQRRALLLPQELRLLKFEQEVVDLEGHRPILADKILYFDEAQFTARTLPHYLPPDIAPLNLSLAAAIRQGRTRALSIDEVRGLSREYLAFDLSDLPVLNETSTDDDIDRFITAAFDRFVAAPATPLVKATVSPELAHSH